MEFRQAQTGIHGSMRQSWPAFPAHEPNELLGRLLGDFTALAMQLCQAPIALVSQLQGHFAPCAGNDSSRRQWWRFPEQSGVLCGDNGYSLCEGVPGSIGGLCEIGDLLVYPGWTGTQMAHSVQGLRFYAAAGFAHPQGAFTGTLCVLDRQARSLAPTQRSALHTLARQLGEQLTLHGEVQHLRQQTLTDALTGIGNRRAFDQRLCEEWTRHLRSGKPMSLLMIDLNRFKQYNDSFGHPAGDAVLAQLGQSLRQPLRESDFVARYGGDEFAVILPDTDEAGACQAAERLHATVHKVAWMHRPVSLSIGLATLPPNQMNDFGQLLEIADQAMYASKRRCQE